MKIVCLGLMVCDILVKPITKEMLDKDSGRVEFVRMSSGGDAFNEAVCLAKLGMTSSVVGKVGRDGFGDFLLDTAIKNGVGTNGVATTDECGTSTSVVLIHPDGERTFAYYGGANDRLGIDDIDFGMIKDAGILIVGSAFDLPSLDGEGLAYIMKRAKESGVKTVLDITGNPDRSSMEILKDTLKNTDIFLPSFYEARSITGKETPEEISDDILKLGVGLAVVKMGGSGCYIRSGDESAAVPPFKVAAVDTTGAGDSFTAGFVTAYSKGWPLYECGRFANAVGALCVQEIGATAGVRPLEDVLAFMKRLG